VKTTGVLVDHGRPGYELDRDKIPAGVLASPLTPALLPTSAAWRTRRVEADVETPADCSPR